MTTSRDITEELTSSLPVGSLSDNRPLENRPCVRGSDHSLPNVSWCSSSQGGWGVSHVYVGVLMGPSVKVFVTWARGITIPHLIPCRPYLALQAIFSTLTLPCWRLCWCHSHCFLKPHPLLHWWCWSQCS